MLGHFWEIPSFSFFLRPFLVCFFRKILRKYPLSLSLFFFLFFLRPYDRMDPDGVQGSKGFSRILIFTTEKKDAFIQRRGFLFLFLLAFLCPHIKCNVRGCLVTVALNLTCDWCTCRFVCILCSAQSRFSVTCLSIFSSSSSLSFFFLPSSFSPLNLVKWRVQWEVTWHT